MLGFHPISGAALSEILDENAEAVASFSGSSTASFAAFDSNADSGTRVLNSLSYGNGGAGLRVVGHLEAEVFNCTLTGNTGFGLVISGSEDTQAINNIVFNNTAGEIDSSSSVLTTNLTTDPDFVDAGAGDYHLLEGSPAINAGTDLSAEGVLFDFDGNPRPIDDFYDIGAYEFFSESSEIFSEGDLVSSGLSTFNAVGQVLAQEGVLSASGVATFNAVGEAPSSVGELSASGQSTVEFFGQNIPAAQVENPKRYLIFAHDVRIGANGIVEIDGRLEDLSIYPGSNASPFLSSGTPGGSSPPPEPPDDGDDNSDNSKPGATRLVLLDVPQLTNDQGGPQFLAAATGTSDGWDGALVFERVGSEFVEILQISTRSAIGIANNKLQSGPVTLFDASGRTFVFDDTNTVDVTLTDGVSTLASVSDADLLAGVNSAALGRNGRWEILAYGVATQLDERKWRLSHFLRGLKGTEWAVGLHQSGDTFVPLTEALRRRVDAFTDLDIKRRFRAASIGNPVDSGSQVEFTNTGVSLKPLSPVYVRGEEDAEGNRVIRWYRRSRLDGLAGRDADDGTYLPAPPLGEAFERYEVDILNSAGTVVLRTLTVNSEFAVYSAALQTVDFGSVPSSLRVCIYQMSDRGRGYGACTTISSFEPGEITPADSDRIYDVYVYAPGVQRTERRVLAAPIMREVLFPAGLPLSRAVARKFGAAAESIYLIKKNGTSVGTVTFGAGQTVGVVTSSDDIVINPASDVLEIIEPVVPDVTLSDVGIAIAGVRI